MIWFLIDIVFCMLCHFAVSTREEEGGGGILSMPDPTLRRCSSWVVYLMMILIIISVVFNSISLFAVSTRGGSCQRLTPPQRRCSSWVVCPMMIQIVSAVRTLSLAQMITRKRRKDQNLRWSMKVKFHSSSIPKSMCCLLWPIEFCRSQTSRHFIDNLLSLMTWEFL